MAFIGSKEFLLEISKGNVAGHVLVNISGRNKSAGSTLETVWEASGTVAFPTAATTMTISSDNANDASAGTGLRTIEVQGLNSSHASLIETITLNGTTAVSSTNSYLRINKLVGKSAGTGRTNAGTVYIGTGSVTAGKPAVIINLVNPSQGNSRPGFFTIPASKTGFVTDVSCVVEANKGATIEIMLDDPATISRVVNDLKLSDVVRFEINWGTSIVEKTDVEFRSKSDGAPADVSITSLIVLVDN